MRRLALLGLTMTFTLVSLVASQHSKNEVLDILNRVNTYWQKQNPNPGNAFWDVATYHTGNMEAYFLTKNPDYLAYSEKWAVHNQWMGAKSNDRTRWRYNYGENDLYVLFGDWQICFQTYIDLYHIEKDEQKIKRAIEVMEYQMSTPNNDYWWWVDGLYMVMPVMTKLYHITGNQLYLDKLYDYFIYARDLMYDEETKIFYRDAKYVYPKHKSVNGKKDFWARGNGWLFAGLAKILNDLPDSWEHKNVFRTHYLDMAAALKAEQQADGYWTRSIMDPAHAPGPETSGTAFFTYGYLWGINNGYLRKSDYLETALKGWKYLSGFALQPDGKVGYIQPIGERAIPGQVVNANSTSNFGVGAFLLATAEKYRYLDNLDKQPVPSKANAKNKYTAYLFTYFTGNNPDEEQIRFAISYDGFSYKTLNNNQPVISSKKISRTGGVRDPHILRTEDGKYFYMIVTDMTSNLGWSSNRGMVLLKSKDMVNWTSSTIHIPSTYPEEFGRVDRVWAPQTIYDPEADKYMIYFSMRAGDYDYDKIYYAYANKDFTAFEHSPKQMFYHPERKSAIDGDIIYKDGKWHMFFKTEGHGNGLKKAVSKSLTSGWVLQDKYLQQTRSAVEGSAIFRLNDSDEYILIYDVYMDGRYDFTSSTDLENFTLVDRSKVKMDFHPRHGTVLPITAKEAKRLEKKWGGKIDTGFPAKQKSWNNPALKGLYADPDIIYSEKTKRYYIYPTSDGYDGWSGKYFKVFSSKNLKKWKDEGVILTLGEDVKWADRNAWAPCIIERKVDGKYKYFYYFTAAQKIGVAVADHPTGPFVDLGKPLLSSLPPGVNGGQVIDPDVFHDPVSGKYYIYWGNGFMAGAELNDDMVSIKEETITIMTPRGGQFREGAHVFYRNGQYYFMWSIDDTRSPDYRVAYGFADSPLGRITRPDNFVVLRKDEQKGIYGTGHHSTINVPGTDKWYIVYHRFNYPDGIKMGQSAGFNREVCIDIMEFNADGTIKQVIPTHKGIR